MRRRILYHMPVQWNNQSRQSLMEECQKGLSSLLRGTANSVIQPLQKIQNFAARLVLLAPRHHHSTSLLEKLHWLPTSERLKYQVACMCFSAINGSHSISASTNINTKFLLQSFCVCVCVCACVHACVRACVRACLHACVCVFPYNA